jgi:hypothetical protein
MLEDDIVNDDYDFSDEFTTGFNESQFVRQHDLEWNLPFLSEFIDVDPLTRFKLTVKGLVGGRNVQDTETTTDHLTHTQNLDFIKFDGQQLGRLKRLIEEIPMIQYKNPLLYVVACWVVFGGDDDADAVERRYDEAAANVATFDGGDAEVFKLIRYVRMIQSIYI